MAALRDCVKSVVDLDNYDVDDIVDGINDYQKRGMSPKDAALAAARDVLSDAEGSRDSLLRAAEDQFAKKPEAPAAEAPKEAPREAPKAAETQPAERQQEPPKAETPPPRKPPEAQPKAEPAPKEPEQPKTEATPEEAPRRGSDAGTLSANPFLNPATYKPIVEALRKAGVIVKDFVTFRDAMSATPFSQGGVPTEKLRDFLIRRIQNKYHALGLVQKQIEQGGKKLDDMTDTMLATTLFPGRAGRRIQNIERTHVRPLLEAVRQVAKNKEVSLDDIGNYLYARHAAERNAVVREKNAELPDGGSGMTDAEAKKILADFNAAGKTAALERVAKLVYALGAEKKRIVRAGKLLPEEAVRAWDRYKFYVPLKGEEIDASFTGGGGSGFSVRGLGEKQATGRFSKAANIIENMIVDVQLAQIRAEKAEVGRTFLRMVEANPNSKLWTVDKLPHKAVVGADGMVRYSSDGLAALDKERTVIVTDEKGEVRVITLRGDMGKLLARAINNTGVESSNAALRTVGKFSRLFAALQTKYNPQFTATNLLRDIQTAAINAGVDFDAKLAKEIVLDVPQAAAAIWRDARGKAGTGDWDKWHERFAASGGETHFLGIGDIETKAKQIETAYKEGEGNLFALGKNGVNVALDVIGDANVAVENAMRLSVFRRLVERGMTDKRAAEVSKSLTVNFNRHGELGPLLNSLYVFFNAGVQGTTRMLKAIMTKKGASIIIGGGGALGYALSRTNRQLSDTDEDGVSYYDKIPMEVKNKWAIMMAPYDVDLPGLKLRAGRDYLKLFPIPFGYGIGYNMGAAADDAITAEDRNQSRWIAAARVASAFAESFNPLGQSSILQALAAGDGTAVGTELSKLVSPTITDPFLEIAANRDWQGNLIYKEQPQFGRKQPDSQVSLPQTSDASKSFAQWVNKSTGGDAYSPGGIDVSPDMLDYIVRQYSGGAGRFWFNLGQTTANIATGKPIDQKRIPFAGLVVGETRASPYNEYRRVVNEIEADVERRKDTGDTRDDLYELDGQKRRVESFVRKAQQRKRALAANGDEEGAKELEQEIESKMKGLLRSYYERGGQQAAGI